eukprot:363511-Chlamydomonas_euryale.AAC.1
MARTHLPGNDRLPAAHKQIQIVRAVAQQRRLAGMAAGPAEDTHAARCTSGVNGSEPLASRTTRSHTPAARVAKYNARFKGDKYRRVFRWTMDTLSLTQGRVQRNTLDVHGNGFELSVSYAAGYIVKHKHVSDCRTCSEELAQST